MVTLTVANAGEHKNDNVHSKVSSRVQVVVPRPGEGREESEGPSAVFCNVGQASGLRAPGPSRGGGSGECNDGKGCRAG